jgi:hypothetical protein
LERVLQGLRRRLLEPGEFNLPGRKMVRHLEVADELVSCCVILLLQLQSLVEHESAGSGKADHVALLIAGWHQFVLEGLKPLHHSSIRSRAGPCLLARMIRQKKYPAIRTKL